MDNLDSLKEAVDQLYNSSFTEETREFKRGSQITFSGKVQHPIEEKCIESIEKLAELKSKLSEIDISIEAKLRILSYSIPKPEIIEYELLPNELKEQIELLAVDDPCEISQLNNEVMKSCSDSYIYLVRKFIQFIKSQKIFENSEIKIEKSLYRKAEILINDNYDMTIIPQKSIRWPTFDCRVHLSKLNSTDLKFSSKCISVYTTTQLLKSVGEFLK